MTNVQPRPDSSITRILLDQAIEARQKYAEYLRAVASGERPADPAERERLCECSDQALQAWRQAHEAWSRTGRPALASDPAGA